MWPTQGATQNVESLYPELKGPTIIMGVTIANSRGHTKAWECVSPTQGATQNQGSLYPQLKGPHQSWYAELKRPNKIVGLCIPKSTGHTTAWGVHPKFKGPHRSVAFRLRRPYWLVPKLPHLQTEYHPKTRQTNHFHKRYGCPVQDTPLKRCVLPFTAGGGGGGLTVDNQNPSIPFIPLRCSAEV